MQFATKRKKWTKVLKKYHKWAFLKHQAYLGFNWPSMQICIELNAPSGVISSFGRCWWWGPARRLQPSWVSLFCMEQFGHSPFLPLQFLQGPADSLMVPMKLSTSMSEAPPNFERSAFLFFSLDSPVLPKLEADGRVVGD